ncbi:hypothetical protein ACFDTO_05725 [Microbacteriaceae bacterium 4G12]
MSNDIDPTRNDETASADDGMENKEANGPSADGIADGSGTNTGSDDVEDDSASGHGDS